MLAASEPHGAGTLAVSRLLVGGSGWERAGQLKNDATCFVSGPRGNHCSFNVHGRAANDSLPFVCHQETKTTKKGFIGRIYIADERF